MDLQRNNRGRNSMLTVVYSTAINILMRTNLVSYYAPFLVGGAWQWHRFAHASGNKHEACTDYATEIGASCFDASQASVKIAGSVVNGHPTVFA